MSVKIFSVLESDIVLKLVIGLKYQVLPDKLFLLIKRCSSVEVNIISEALTSHKKSLERNTFFPTRTGSKIQIKI